jgi:presequence protease
MAAWVVASVPVATFEENQVYHGFRLAEKRFVPEVNAECLYFIHEQSGARLLKIAADDPNKLFNVAFKTLPENSTGVPHIMEHAVLMGSQSFPVKSPFYVLLRGSLNTFLNAMTGADRTTYPVASMNHKDYFNLMHVYLDGVFFPRIYDDPRIFLQEGWHYELEDMDSDIVYKGVVFNEMKGAYSSPFRVLNLRTNEALFPDNAYGVCSGGYPDVIPDLSYEEFLDFHRTFYHPSNSYITLYGDADLDAELEFINRKYLSHFERSDAVIHLPLQAPFTEMKVLEKPYAVAEDSDTNNNTYINLSFVAGKGVDRDLVAAMQVLATALVNHETAPVKRALQEAGIGSNVSAGLSRRKQNVFTIQVHNANTSDMEQYREVVLNTMREVVKNGFDREMLEGIINRMEFSLREGDTSNKGLMYIMANYFDWFFAGDPFAGLEFEQSLAYVRQALEKPLLEGLIEEHLLDNPHSVLLALYPEPGLETTRIARERERLAAYQASLSEEELQALVQQTKDLRAFQLEEDTPEALATVPMLSLEDISPEINWYELHETNLNGVPVMHYEDFTNDIVYANMYFDLRVLPEELLPYARLLSAIMRQLGTTEQSYGDFDNAINIHTGGISTYLVSYQGGQSDDNLLPYFVASGRAAVDKAGHLTGLITEMLISFNLKDQGRLKTLVRRHQAGVESQVINDGMGYAVRRMNSYYSRKGKFDEVTNGLTYYRFITHLNRNINEEINDLVVKLQDVAGLLFSKENMMVLLSGSENNYRQFAGAFQPMAQALPASRPGLQQWELALNPSNEGLQSASMVQYVVQGYSFRNLGYEYDGRMRVLNQILSREYLQTRIRIMGGAYGGFMSLNPTGELLMISYRDPNLQETLDNYQGSVSFLEEFDADETTMTRYIIGTIAGLDRPLTASERGMVALRRHMEGITPEALQAEREAILSTTAEDIRQMRQLIADVLARNTFCVYGNEDKIRENSELFRDMFSITE